MNQFRLARAIDRFSQRAIVAVATTADGLLDTHVGQTGGGRNLRSIFIALDDFKQINDTCGHDMGVARLREFAKLARDGFRTTDFVAVVEDLPAAGNEPESILQRMREKLDVDLTFGDRLIRISASIGAAVSDCTTDSTSPLRRADQVMYQAKLQGKNQTVISQ